MPPQPKRNFQTIDYKRIPRLHPEEDVFDHPLESSDDPAFKQETAMRKADLQEESPAQVLTVEPSLHAIRRAIQELESGRLDELIIANLISLDRNSAEFRQEYVRLRALSLTRPRALPSSWSEAHTMAIINNEIGNEEETYWNSPWNVNSLWDLWRFFGPGLTLLTAIQLFCSFKLATLLRKLEILPGNLSFTVTSFIIALLFLIINMLILNGCKGQDHQKFVPRLLGIGIVSSVIAIMSFLLVKVI
jgi:hypothetical protein